MVGSAAKLENLRRFDYGQLGPDWAASGVFTAPVGPPVPKWRVHCCAVRTGLGVLRGGYMDCPGDHFGSARVPRTPRDVCAPKYGTPC